MCDLGKDFQEERNEMSRTQAKTGFAIGLFLLARQGGLHEGNATRSMPPCMA
jgi:hypothetical protein